MGKGGSVWAVPKSSRNGMGTTTSRGACPVPELALLWPPAQRPQRCEPSLRSLPASLGVRPPLVPPGGSLCCLGSCRRGRGLNQRRVWCRMSGDHAWNGTYGRGGVCKAPMENVGAKMEQCNNKTNKLDDFHTNSYEIRTNFTMPQYSHPFIHVKFVRNSDEFRTNFT